jgi:hypothetical protein
MKNLVMTITMLLAVAFTGTLLAQDEPPKIDQSEKKAVVDTLALKMETLYVFPDKGKEMADFILQQYQNGAYDEAENANEFSGQLTDDLRSISHDLHIGVRYNPETIAMIRQQDENDDDSYGDFVEEMNRMRNYGFEEMKILAGNVGYLKLNMFAESENAFRTASAAMNFLSNSDALIIDLRSNGGGSPLMIQLISTYLFDDYDQHLNSFFYRPADETRQFWTLPYVPGKKIPGVPVFVLTSSRTFSAAEEFTYNLKNMKRATIVGDTTGGGAHPVNGYELNDNFMVSIPIGRAVNPITKTNWEGTGIAPHFACDVDKAKDVAYLMALDSVLLKLEDPRLKDEIVWVKEGLDARANLFLLDEKTMKTYAGKYGPRTIIHRDGELFYQREDRPEYRMIPMNINTFLFDEIEYFRLRVIVEGKKALAVEGIYDNGRTDRNERDK